jgi:hypothetical protein
MIGHFSDVLIEIINALSLGEQVILFQNRRGYSPIIDITLWSRATMPAMRCKFNVS